MGATHIGEKTKDVTDNAGCWGGFQPGQIYVLAQNTFLRKINENKYTLVPEGVDERKSQGINYPKTFNEYKNNPESFSDFTIIEKGLRIKCSKIIFWNNGTFSKIKVYGVFLDGKYKNSEVYLNQVSKAANQSVDGPFCRAPDENYLQPE